MSSRERFIRCKHCGLPHEAGLAVCPVTNKPMASDRPRRARTPSEEGREYKWVKSLHPHSRPIADEDMDEHSYEGTVIDGKYAVKALLGKGGMGAVYRAENTRIGKQVAIKVLLRGHRKGSDAEKRFIREARIAGALGHPGIVEIYDLGTLENGVPFQVMELLEGETLAARIKHEGALPIDELLDVAEQVLSALDIAHARGIIHRDLKPENVFLAVKGDAVIAKLLDFGISKALGEETLSLTKTGMVVGTPYYLAPEQARGDAVDARCDVWAMGVLVYEALTGRLPYRADNYNKLLVSILTTRPTPAREIRPAIPEAIEQVIQTAMSHDPEARYANGKAMLRALREARGRQSIPSYRPPPPAAMDDISVPESTVPLDLEDPNDDPTEVSDMFARSRTLTREGD
jgi:serine/threonine-protein kinase